MIVKCKASSKHLSGKNIHFFLFVTKLTIFKTEKIEHRYFCSSFTFNECMRFRKKKQDL